MQELTLWEKKSMYTDLVSVHDQLRKFRIKISKGWNIQQPRISINLLQVSVYSTLRYIAWYPWLNVRYRTLGFRTYLFQTLFCVFSSCFEHNYLWLTNQDTFAYAAGALCEPGHSTWLAPLCSGHATVKELTMYKAYRITRRNLKCVKKLKSNLPVFW